jgi:hypothetical protein
LQVGQHDTVDGAVVYALFGEQVAGKGEFHLV